MSQASDRLVAELNRWYLDPASRTLPLDAAIAAAADRVVEAGIPLWRISSVLPTAHPEVLGMEALWIRGQGCQLREMSRTVLESAAYLQSPVVKVMTEGRLLRFRLEDPDAPRPYPILDELARQGATDYVISPLVLSQGRLAAYSFASDRPGGFTDDQVEALLAVAPILALRHELRATRYALESLLGLYLGKNAGRRVAAGGFRRGTGELIRAAIWYSDMRGFTELGDQLPPRELVPLLDEYFTVLGSPIEEHGGEILKFIGDAVLAIFPVGSGDESEPCRRALTAAKGALRGLAGWNDARVERGHAPIGTGIALHLGTVMYGNIGSRDRLDFTVIGRSVNEAARVEGLCKEVERPLLMTAQFASALGDPAIVSLGTRTLRGVAAPIEIFTVDG